MDEADRRTNEFFKDVKASEKQVDEEFTFKVVEEESVNYDALLFGEQEEE